MESHQATEKKHHVALGSWSEALWGEEYIPSHPQLFEIRWSGSKGEYGSGCYSKKAYRKGDIICPMDFVVAVHEKTWATVQFRAQR